ncbi:MAG: hypothetical protein Roseis3KO_28570 [Roseivirga sp.]
MKKIRLILIVAFTAIFIQLSQAQDYLNWAITLGDVTDELVDRMIIDDNENTYIIGELLGVFDMDPSPSSTVNVRPSGAKGAFLAKFDKTGALQWAISLNVESVEDLVLNGSGSVIVLGTYINTATFGGTTTISNTRATITSSTSIFIASFDTSNGSFQGVGNMEGTLGQTPYRIEAKNGNIIVTGIFFGTVDFDFGATTADFTNSGNSADIFIAKYDSQGAFAWAKTIPSNNVNNSIDDVKADDNGNVYIAGRLVESLDFQNGTNLNSVSDPKKNAFIAKYTSTGTYEWHRRATNVTPNNSRSGFYSIELDANNDITLAGFIQNAITLEGFTPNTFGDITTSDPDVFVVKYAPDGTGISAIALGGDGDQFALDHDLDAEDNYIIAGIAQGSSSDFDPDEDRTFALDINDNAQYDVFVAKYNPDLSFQWAGAFKGTNDNDWVYSVSASNQGNIYLAGYTQDTPDFDFDTNTIVQNSSAGGRDLMVASLNNVSTLNQNINLCLGGSITVNGNTYNAVGSYQDIITGGAMNGKDSVVNTTIESILPAITLSSTSTSPTCVGGNDGAVTIVASDAATRNYQYSINGVTSQASPTFTDLVAGFYTVWVEDQDGCVASVNFQVLPPAPITATTIITAPFCHGDPYGIITVNATGGSGTYTYSIDGVNFRTSPSFIEYPAGQYTITIKDSNDCTGTITATITEPDLLQLFEDTLVNPTCGGEATGLLDVAAIGGTAPYEYSIDGVNFGTSNIFDNLAAGSYTVTVKDDKGCTTTLSRTLTAPDVLVPGFGKVDVSCNGDSSGAITGNASGGVGPYSFSIDGTNFQTGTFNSLTAGDYTLTVKDANDCTAAITVTIDEPTMFNVTATKTDVTCRGADDGTITLFASGGTTGGGSIFINNVATTSSSFSDLVAGTYDFRVLDANMCEVTLTVTITEPDVLALSATATNVTCNGDADGQITLTPTGGTAPYEYSLDGVNFQSAASFSNLAPTNYSITVRDANGCTAMTTSTVTEPTPLSLAFVDVDVTCNGADDGQIAGAASGGTGPYTYSLDGTNFQTGIFSNLAPADYTLTAKDANDCTTTTNVTIAEPNVLVLATTKTDVSCNGLEDGTISVTPSGGIAPFVLRVNDVVQQGTTLTGMAPGSYSIKITDANQCEVTEIVVINEPVALSLAAAATNVNCNGAADGQIALTPTGGTAPFEYSLDGTTFQSAATFTGLAPESYTITVRDANGCTSTATAAITEPDALTVSVSLNNFNIITAMASGGTAPYEYAIDGTFQSSGTFSNLANGNYTVTVRDANGCTAAATQTLIVTSVDEPLLVPVVRSYPNPAKDYVLISEVASGDVIRLVNLSGKTMSQTNIQVAQQDYRQDISAIRQAMFMLIITDKSGRRKLRQKVMRVQ